MNLTRRRNARRSTAASAASISTERQPSPDEGWETLGLSSTEYARKRREMMQLVNDLHSLGGATVIDLPSIVVIGGQSAGKSSLVEAVSGVNVPRDSGTCTRCPMQCTLSGSTTTWSCTIKLRFDNDDSPRPTEVAFGPTITDKDDVEIWLRRAQAAILNPDRKPQSFHTQSIQELKNSTPHNSLKFSRNVVSIFIQDPGATDLCFFDLPGLIQNEEQEVVDLVRQLTESYISRPNTIILTTIPMTDDMDNQQSVNLARRADPDGERTIGVLTKPDMLGGGAISSRQTWREVIEGNKYPLKHGYYCVRLPDDAQRAKRLSRSELQRIAADYFETTTPWSEVAGRGRFGIPAFVTDISALLVNHINRVIPHLRNDVERLLTSCIREINALPKPLEGDPQSEVLKRVSAFCDAFRGAVLGASSDKSLAQRNRKHYGTFAQEVRGTSPDFRPFEKPKEYMQIDVLDSEEHANVRNNKVQTMGVYEVRKTITDSIAWELPGNIPYEAKTRLINQFTELWFAPAEKCLASINNVLDSVIQQLGRTHFGRFRVLQDLISDLIRPDVEEYKGNAQTAVEETLRLEFNPIYTQNLKDFQDLRGRWYIKYRKARRNPGKYQIPIKHAVPPAVGSVGVTLSPQPVPVSVPTSTLFSPGLASPPAVQYSPSPESQALDYLAQAGYRGLTVDDLIRLSPQDHFEDELVVMADVRAYFTIACKRVIDHVPLKIQQTLHEALAERLSGSLLQRIVTDLPTGSSFAERAREWVSEDPVTQVRRFRLEARRIQLREMKTKLDDFAE